MDSTTTTTNTNVNFSLLGAQVTEALERYHVPGVAVGVIHEGRNYTAGFGVTNVNHPLEVTPDTLFQVGSTTKTVTATATMRLIERGMLDLNTPLRAYLPELRLADEEVAARVTLRHLFTHTAGWEGDYFDDTGAGDDALAIIVSRMVDLKQLTPLGEVFSYNNAGFYLAGRVIERATGQAYEAAIQDLVLDPLGMARSFFFAESVITDRVAVGHRVNEEDRPVAQREWALARAAHSAGGLISSVEDQLRYAHFHMGDGTAADGTRVLSPASMALMQSPLASAGPSVDALGVTWMLRDVAGTRLVQHGGTTNGQLSAFVMAPAHGFAITVLTNADRGGQLHHDITTWALRHYLGVAEPEPVRLDVPTDNLAAFAGRYSARGSDLDMTLDDEGLILRVTPRGGFPRKDSPARPAPPPMRVAAIGEDRVVIVEGPFEGQQAEFLRRPDGGIAWLRMGVRAYARQD
jgi:CubicO group peptidase (beta-lactamase class C family)